VRRFTAEFVKLEPLEIGEKRVRICAADNEAWRAALSLLRVAVADEEDLEHVLGQNPYGEVPLETEKGPFGRSKTSLKWCPLY
jgi:hypothetical protein